MALGDPEITLVAGDWRTGLSNRDVGAISNVLGPYTLVGRLVGLLDAYDDAYAAALLPDPEPKQTDDDDPDPEPPKKTTRRRRKKTA